MPERSVSDLIRLSWEQDDPTGWFEQVYAQAEAGEGRVPWAHMQTYPVFQQWLDREQPQGAGRRALVVGCGLGDDAEALAARGFTVTAFDVSETAIEWARRRFPGSHVDYQVADLLKLPDAWRRRFDFVLEIRTIQALPVPLAPDVMGAIAGTVAGEGTLLVICHGRDPQQPAQGIPWALSPDDLDTFTQHGLTPIEFEDLPGAVRLFRVAYRRSAGA